MKTLVWLAGLTACVDDTQVVALTSTEHETTGVMESGDRPIEESAEAIGLLRLLADPEVTEDLLRDELGLDPRAAKNLAEHRDGPDAVFGSDDDDRYGTVAEIDDTPWVGTDAFERLLAYANDFGYTPIGDDFLGVWDGVVFTAAEAERILDVANMATLDELDFDVPLDRRAAEAIVEARPIYTVSQLADAYFVGEDGLERLRAYAESGWESGGNEANTTAVRTR